MKRPLLLPLVPLYAAVLAVKRRLSAEGRRLGRPVISVGSLSAGGAGKTPVVEALARLLMRTGYTVDILSRGYGRAATAVVRVDPKGSAESFGDEPLLLTRRTGAAVYVGAERYAAGLLAERDATDRQRLLHLLDDGFQHRRLARDLDLVLFTVEDARDCLLPAGNLREPLTRLRDADVVVLREEEEAVLRPVVVKLAGVAKAVWVIRRRLEMLHDVPQRPLAFCGIARAESFFSMLRAEGVDLKATVAFGDHHAYRERDIERLIKEARGVGADGFITTEKDEVKISSQMRKRLEASGLAVARLVVEFVDENAVFGRIQGLDGSSAA